MKLLVIAGNELRRMFRDRVTLALAFALPIVLILVIGATATTAEPRLGLVVDDEGPLAVELGEAIHAIEELAVVDRSREALSDDLRRGDLSGGVVIPPGYDQALRSGDETTVEYLAIAAAGGFDVSGLIEAEVAAQSARVRAARLASAESGLAFDQVLILAAQATTPRGIGVEVVGASGGEPEPSAEAFAYVSAAQLLLFVFLTAMASSTLMIQARRLRVGHRMLSTPTRPATIVAGSTLGRLLVSLSQALFIVVVSAALFGVDWADWPATLVIVTLFSLIGTGAGVLVGTRTDSEQMAGTIAGTVGLTFALVGGSMGIAFGALAKITPHGWALDAFEEVLAYGATIVDILPQLGVLALVATVLMAAATWSFRKSITA